MTDFKTLGLSVRYLLLFVRFSVFLLSRGRWNFLGNGLHTVYVRPSICLSQMTSCLNLSRNCKADSLISWSIGRELMLVVGASSSEGLLVGLLY